MKHNKFIKLIINQYKQINNKLINSKIVGKVLVLEQELFKMYNKLLITQNYYNQL